MADTTQPDEDPRKILLIKIGAMGDLVMASSFFHNLRQQFSNAEIVLLIGKTYASILEPNPCIDRLIPIDDKTLYKGNIFTRLQETLRILRILKQEKFGLVFVMHKAWQFNLLAWLSGIPRRAGYSRGREGWGLTDAVAPDPNGNEREAYLDLLRAINSPAVYERSFFYLSEDDDRFLASFLEKHQISEEEDVVGIGPGGGKNVKSFMPTRRWPAENFIALIQRLTQMRSCRVILFGGPDERELAQKILAACPECVNAIDLKFGEMASVFRRCQLFIGNDSGPLHIADAMQIHTLGLFGPTNPKVQAPLGPLHFGFYKHVECSPCFDNGRFPECDHITCLQSITVEEVWDKARDLSGKQRP